MMDKQKNPRALTGIAGVHFVVSELSRRGMIALPTIRNTAGYDIIVASADGERHANIQVKTSYNKANFWLMPSPEKIHDGASDYYVCVRWLKAEHRFEAFMLKGSEARREVDFSVKKQGERKMRKGRRGIWPSLHVGGQFQTRSDRWKKRWQEWFL